SRRPSGHSSTSMSRVANGCFIGAFVGIHRMVDREDALHVAASLFAKLPPPVAAQQVPQAVFELALASPGTEPRGESIRVREAQNRAAMGSRLDKGGRE